MEVKDILMNSEDALPTLSQNLSTGTEQSRPSLPTITANESTYWKTGASVVLGVAGMLFLGMGKKEKDFNKMVIGAALTLASFFLF